MFSFKIEQSNEQSSYSQEIKLTELAELEASFWMIHSESVNQRFYRKNEERGCLLEREEWWKDVWLYWSDTLNRYILVNLWKLFKSLIRILQYS